MFEKYLHFSIIAVMLPAVYTGFFPGKIVVVNALCMIIYLIFMWYYRNRISIKDFDCKNIILFYFIYTIFEYIRGFFNIDGWRDYVYLYNGLFHLIIFPLWILLARPQYIHGFMEIIHDNRYYNEYYSCFLPSDSWNAYNGTQYAMA